MKSSGSGAREERPAGETQGTFCNWLGMGLKKREASRMTLKCPPKTQSYTCVLPTASDAMPSTFQELKVVEWTKEWKKSPVTPFPRGLILLFTYKAKEEKMSPPEIRRGKNPPRHWRRIKSTGQRGRGGLLISLLHKLYELQNGQGIQRKWWHQ